MSYSFLIVYPTNRMKKLGPILHHFVKNTNGKVIINKQSGRCHIVSKNHLTDLLQGTLTEGQGSVLLTSSLK
jgi:hypothetical protein